MLDEATVAATLTRYAEAWQKRDRATWLEAFTSEAWQEDPIGTPVNYGLAQIGAFFDRAMAQYSRIELHPRRIYLAGDEAAMTWEIVGEDENGSIRFDGIDVFTFTPTGLIASVRAFWRKEDMDRQPGPSDK